MRTAVLLLPLFLGCRTPNPFQVVFPTSLDIGWWPHDTPRIEGGEVALGDPSGIMVGPVPPGGEVQLLLGFGGEGPGRCDLVDGVCSGLVDPMVRFATTTANDEGIARFRIPETAFDEPGPIAWQALVSDPELPGVHALTEVLVRHVAYGLQDARITFEEVTRRVGLERTFTSGNTHTGGVAFVDLNNDLWPDLYISNGEGQDNYLYRNNGDGSFTDISEAVRKPRADIECAGVKAADIDNDGDIDLIVPVDNPQTMVSSEPQPWEGGPNLLYVNEGDFTFAADPVAQAAAAGLADPRGARNSSAAVADVDLDGCIDVYLTRWAMAAAPGDDNPDRMLKGRCDGTFEDVTAQMGADGKGRDGLVGFFWDHDFDRYPELYVGNNSDQDHPPVFQPRDVFYRNDGGERFVEWEGAPTYDAWAAMGVDIGDLDADGDWELYITDVYMLDPSPHGNVLYEGLPGGELSENRCHEFGLCFGYNSWPTNFEDFDNDGWVDVWVGSSLPNNPDMVFLNRADGTGRMVSHRQEGFLGHIARSGTTADYDGDGDVDIFLFDEGAASSLWNNRFIEPGPDADLTDRHWIELKLRGTVSNRAGIGAVVRTEVGGVKMMRRVTGGDSAHAHRMLELHFGLGATEVLDRIEITWPRPEATSPVQVVEGLSADRVWIIDEAAGKVEHSFVDPRATYDAGELEVVTGSNYGGRPQIEVEGLGSLDYDAATRTYRGGFVVKAPPDEIRLLTDYGAPMDVPVDPAQ